MKKILLCCSATTLVSAYALAGFAASTLTLAGDAGISLRMTTTADRFGRGKCSSSARVCEVQHAGCRNPQKTDPFSSCSL